VRDGLSEMSCYIPLVLFHMFWATTEYILSFFIEIFVNIYN
jgi:hypothetical protein